jgi:hypothetical protein
MANLNHPQIRRGWSRFRTWGMPKLNHPRRVGTWLRFRMRRITPLWQSTRADSAAV